MQYIKTLLIITLVLTLPIIGLYGSFTFAWPIIIKALFFVGCIIGSATLLTYGLYSDYNK